MRTLLFVLTCMILQTATAQAPDIKWGKVSDEELMSKEHKYEKDANAAILYRDHNSYFTYSGTDGFYLTTDVHERIKIYNKDGYKWATKVLNKYTSGSDREKISNLKGYTYNLIDGKEERERLRNDGIFEEEKNKYVETTTFTMPDIREGSVIEYKYTLITPFITDINDFRFQESIPVDYATTKMIVPEYFGYKIHYKGSIPINMSESSNEDKLEVRTRNSIGLNSDSSELFSRNSLDYQTKIYTTGMKDVPPLIDEAFTGNIDNYASAIKYELQYTRFPNSGFKQISTTWESVTNSIYKSQSFGGQLERSRYFDDDLSQVTAGKDNDMQKMLAIFDYVKQKMTWNGYIGLYAEEGVKQAYKKGSGNTGDINLMLVAMLKEAGLNANPVILSTKSNGIPVYPTRNGFNYVIASVILDEGLMLMDATTKLGEVNILQDNLLNWNGRLIREDGSSEAINLMPGRHAEQNTMVTLNLDATTNSIKGKSMNKFTGHNAYDYRLNLGNRSADEQRKKVEGNYTDVELFELKTKNLDVLYKPVVVTYDFEAFNGVEEIGGKLFVSPLCHLAMKENPFKAEKREFPIDYSHPYKERFIVTVNVPEGYTIESLPEATAIGLPDNYGSFIYKAVEAGGNVQLSVETAINDAIVPSAYYPQLKKFYETMVEKQNEKIVLIKS